jgi:hypothetical protein
MKIFVQQGSIYECKGRNRVIMDRSGLAAFVLFVRIFFKAQL